MELMPNENIVYFGDTARVPYGSKSARAVTEYSLEAAAFLQSRGVKMIIIACNTASAVALEQVRAASNVPVLGVIAPGARAALEVSRSRRIGVIGTDGTIRSNAYQDAIVELQPDAYVIGQPCPLFVGFAEEGLDTHAATRIMAGEYLAPLVSESVDSLILGCTHYPILHRTIQDVVGDAVHLVDPGIATAEDARGVLMELDLLNDSNSLPRHSYYLSDFPHKFVEVGERFLGHPLHEVHRITLDELVNLG
jgi:glutamate racemase